MKFKRALAPTPRCCPEMRASRLIILRFTSIWAWDELAGLLDSQPKEQRLDKMEALLREGTFPLEWGFREAGRDVRPPTPRFCPFCARAMPAFKVKPREQWAARVHVPEYGGDYCGTCKRRASACRCADTLSVMRPKRSVSA